MTPRAGDQPSDTQPVGILMLDTRFPRPPGDIGHPDTFSFPVLYRVVGQATPNRVVLGGADGLVGAFRDAARELEAAGAGAIATSCGFLALHQPALAAAVRVPVFTSALLQLPTILAALGPDRRVGVLTFDAGALSPAHFAGVGVAGAMLERIAIGGLEAAEALYRPIIENRGPLDVEAAEEQVVAVAVALVRSHPDVGAILLECTNLPPYAAAIQHATGLPVWDAVTLVRWAHAAISRRPYERATVATAPAL